MIKYKYVKISHVLFLMSSESGCPNAERNSQSESHSYKFNIKKKLQIEKSSFTSKKSNLEKTLEKIHFANESHKKTTVRKRGRPLKHLTSQKSKNLVDTNKTTSLSKAQEPDLNKNAQKLTSNKIANEIKETVYLTRTGKMMDPHKTLTYKYDSQLLFGKIFILLKTCLNFSLKF